MPCLHLCLLLIVAFSSLAKLPRSPFAEKLNVTVLFIYTKNSVFCIDQIFSFVTSVILKMVLSSLFIDVYWLIIKAFNKI